MIKVSSGRDVIEDSELVSSDVWHHEKFHDATPKALI
jgi:hypothetical protein